MGDVFVLEYSKGRVRLVSGPVTRRQARRLAKPNRFAVTTAEAAKYGFEPRQLQLPRVTEEVVGG